MWRWCAWFSGVLLIAVAIAAVPSIMIVESYVGGSAILGYSEDGRYFVDPGHSEPIVEVSESTWRTVYWVEWLWPWSALLPAWIGMSLLPHGMGPNWKPPPAPPKEMPPWVLWRCLASGVCTVLASLLFWKVVGVPWATMLFAWILICLSVGWVSWLYTRALREQGAPKAAAAADNGGIG
jgi:hypothetical protein